ncbi:MAG: hybrid sensor histidine kinase/response regulator [Desulfomonilia bacterium]
MLLDNSDKAYKRCIDIENASLKAKDLASQLLTFAKGGSPLKKKIPAEVFLRDTVTRSLIDTNVKAEFSLPDGLWSVEIDEVQITQVIGNIVANAVRSMPDGGVVMIRAENTVLPKKSSLPMTEGPYVKIAIEDSGSGMPSEHLEKIFDPFFTTKKQSYGLGLATSYSILQKHGGHITAALNPSRGITITFYLPASPGQEPEKKKRHQKSIHKKRSILFMDDEEFIRDLAQSIFTHLGYEVSFAKDGGEAIRQYQTAYRQGRPFDIVILDLEVNNGMGGRECIQELLKIDPHVKAIVSSGYSPDPIMSNPREYGFRDGIAKPYRIQDLSMILKKIIRED